jgi:Alginate lyase
MDEPEAAPTRRRQRRRSAVVIGGIVFLFVAILIAGGTVAGDRRPTRSPTPSGLPEPTVALPQPGSAAAGFLVSPTDLIERVKQAAAGSQPLAGAMTELVADADAALASAPHPMINLEIPDTDGPFVDDTATAYGLALAYAATGEARYAVGAKAYIQAWVETTTTLTNACPTGGGCQTSLIVARVVPAFVFAADLIRPARVMTVADETALRAWLHDLILPILPTRDGNWGDAGNFARAALTDYLGDRVGFANALVEWRARLDVVPADGHLPDEVRRGKDGMSYSQEALQYKLATARLAELRGTDLWSYIGKGGASLRTAVDFLAAYWFKSADWPYDPAVRVPSPSPMWEIAYQHWHGAAWPAIFAGDRPFGLDGHSAIRWTTLTNGVLVE